MTVCDAKCNRKEFTQDPPVCNICSLFVDDLGHMTFSFRILPCVSLQATAGTSCEDKDPIEEVPALHPGPPPGRVLQPLPNNVGRVVRGVINHKADRPQLDDAHPAMPFGHITGLLPSAQDQENQLPALTAKAPPSTISVAAGATPRVMMHPLAQTSQRHQSPFKHYR